MIACPTCHGRGEVLTPGWYWVQLYELGGWHDYLDYETLQAAQAKAAETPVSWRVRITHRGRIVWVRRLSAPSASEANP